MSCKTTITHRPVTGRLIAVGSTKTISTGFKLFFEMTSSMLTHSDPAMPSGQGVTRRMGWVWRK